MHMRLAAYTFGRAGDFLQGAAGPTGVPTGDVGTVTGTIINGALGMVGIIFFLLMIYAGYLWMTAKGNEEQITKARNIIIACIVGIVIIVGAYAFTQFIASRVIRGAQSG